LPEEEEQKEPEFTRLLDYLKTSRGFDFGAYKVSSLMRRIQKRMREVGVDGYAQYTDYLEVHPHEFGPLFDTVLINVTGFFRDAPSWQFLAERLLPQLLEDLGPDRPVRAWSAGCASGEEAFTLAMLLAEALGEDGFRNRVKIYATDADEGALALARQGSYESRQVDEVPPELAEKYFEQIGSRRVFRPELRRCLIFGRHDLVQDAAISRLDLLLCRNTLMYFNSEAQQRILARFHFALKPTGYLFLGKAETLLNRSGFRPVDLKHRVFRPTSTDDPRDRLLALAPSGAVADPHNGGRNGRLREAAFESGAAAQIVVDRRGYLILANEKARRLFTLVPGDLGKLLQDLEVSYRPIELRSHLDQAYLSRAPVLLEDVETRAAGAEPRHLEIQIVPLLDGKGGMLGASIAFLDRTAARQLQVEVQRAHQELETAYEELQSANEELETTNEELQSTVEELETTNEELQSANEELETMNEELQSTNEELHHMNDQLQQRSEELEQVNTYFASILTGLRAAAVVLDRRLQIQVWSEKAQDLWGLRGEEARGHAFLDLDIGLPVGTLREALRHCLDGTAVPQEEQVELNGVTRRGKSIRCRVQISPLRSSKGIEGVILLMEEVGAGIQPEA
jgi:two-component system CheB/CheR fusion protein